MGEGRNPPNVKENLRTDDFQGMSELALGRLYEMPEIRKKLHDYAKKFAKRHMNRQRSRGPVPHKPML